MFNIVSKPNDWTKQVKKSTSSQPATDTKLLQQEYWQGLKDYMEDNKSFVKMQNPLLQHWTNIAIGKSNFHLSASVNSRDNSINIWLNIMGEQAKENYEKLYEVAYENSLSEVNKDLVWDKMDGRKMSVVMLKSSADFSNKTDWTKQFAWFKDNLERYTKYFKPKIAKI
jgi:hypothetical protein